LFVIYFFIFVSVISALDEQKKLSKEVRLTIRWLEFQLQEGNCNLKSQGIHESLPIKLDGPPKLSKEMWQAIIT